MRALDQISRAGPIGPVRTGRDKLQGETVRETIELSKRERKALDRHGLNALGDLMDFSLKLLLSIIGSNSYFSKR